MSANRSSMKSTHWPARVLAQGVLDGTRTGLTREDEARRSCRPGSALERDRRGCRSGHFLPPSEGQRGDRIPVPSVHEGGDARRRCLVGERSYHDARQVSALLRRPRPRVHSEPSHPYPPLSMYLDPEPAWPRLTTDVCTGRATPGGQQEEGATHNILSCNLVCCSNLPYCRPVGPGNGVPDSGGGGHPNRVTSTRTWCVISTRTVHAVTRGPVGPAACPRRRAQGPGRARTDARDETPPRDGSRTVPRGSGRPPAPPARSRPRS